MSFNIAELEAFLSDSDARSLGKLCVLLFVTRQISGKPHPYTLKPLLTEGGGQIKGLGGSSVQEILISLGYDIPVNFLGEAGRTNRGSVKRAQDYLDWVNKALSAEAASTGVISEIERVIAKQIAEVLLLRKEQNVQLPTDEDDYVGPHFSITNNKVSFEARENSCTPEDLSISSGILNELAKLSLLVKESLGSAHNSYHLLRYNINKYCEEVSAGITEINVFAIYSLGLQLDIHVSAADSKDGEDPPLSAERRALLNSLLVVHATFIGSTELGRKLLAATSHYNIENVDFKSLKTANTTLVASAKSMQIVDEVAASFVQEAVSSALKGKHPTKTGVFALVTSKNFWSTIISGIVLEGIKSSAFGHQLISTTSAFVDKAHQFVSAHAADLIALANSAPDHFQWLIRAIEWLK